MRSLRSERKIGQKTNYIRSQPIKIDNPQKVEALNHTLTSNLTEDTWKDKMLIHRHPN